MKLLGNSGYKLLKSIHIFLSSTWIGAGVCILFLLTVVLNKDNIYGVLLSVHFIVLFIVIPSEILTFITGILFSKYTNWGFFKHRWIIFKYLINLIPLIFGGILFAPQILNMIKIAKETGANAFSSHSFLLSKSIFIMLLVFQLILLMIAIYLSVFKPKLGQK